MASESWRPGGYGGFSATGVGTNAGVTVTKTAPAAKKAHVVSAIQTSGDAACIVTVESPASTVLWRKRYAAAHFASETFDMPIVGAEAQAILVKVSASTSNSEANMQGYTIRA